MGSRANEIVEWSAVVERLSPPLKWAGGKRWLLPRLVPLFGRYRQRRLVEPFVGGLAVALGLAPQKALLNDVNPHLINFYEHLRTGLRIRRSQRNEREYFLRQRERFNRLVADGRGGTVEAAEIFYYLNRTGFNGLCRFNRRGEFNVPFGRYATINYVRDFSPFVDVLGGWTFRCGDFATIKIRANDFLYVDPPYDVEFTTYSAGGFGWSDQERLVEWLLRFAAPTVVSNQATPRILKLYRSAGFKIEKVSAPRMIACNGDRAPAWEMLATRNL